MSFQAEGYDLLFYFYLSNIQVQLYRLQVVCRNLSNHKKTVEQITEKIILALKTTAAPIQLNQ